MHYPQKMTKKDIGKKQYWNCALEGQRVQAQEREELDLLFSSHLVPY
jgi:hypothetical protein